MSTKKQKRKQTVARFRPRSQWEPADWQERHHPTEPVTVRLSVSRTAVLCRRRKQDARLWGALSPAQMQAAEQIELAWRIITGCVATTRPSYVKIQAGLMARAEMAQREARVLLAYQKWIKNCQQRHVPVAPLLEIITQGLSLREVETACGRYHGWGRSLLMRGLDLYRD